MPYEGIGNRAEDETRIAIEETLQLDLEDFYPTKESQSAIQVEIIVGGDWVEDFMVIDDAPISAIVDTVFDYHVTRVDSGRQRGAELLVQAYGIEGIGEKIRGDNRGDIYERRRGEQKPDEPWVKKGQRVRYTGPDHDNPEFPAVGEGGTVIDFWEGDAASPIIKWDHAGEIGWGLEDIEPEPSN